MGQIRQLDFRAVQVVAPKSIMAWLKSYHLPLGIKASDGSHRCFTDLDPPPPARALHADRFIGLRKTCCSSRLTLVSGIGASLRKAKLITASVVAEIFA